MKPKYELIEEDMQGSTAMALHRTLQDYVQQPPAGATFGVRTRKIHIPTDNVRHRGPKRDERVGRAHCRDARPPPAARPELGA